jgi:hypothetical protein
MVEVTGELLQAAEKLVAALPVRTVDAIHVASARLFAAGLATSALTFVSADARQTAVAAAVGMGTEDISSRQSLGRSRDARLSESS